MSTEDFSALKAVVHFAAFRVRGIPLDEREQWKATILKAQGALKRLQRTIEAGEPAKEKP